MSVTRTFDLLQRYAEKFPNKSCALAAKINGEWVKHSTQDYLDNSYQFSYGLMELGFKKGDKIATINNNRPEWNFVDLGMAQLGVIHVPIFTTIDQPGYERILEHSEAKYAIVSDEALYKKIAPLVDKIPTLEKVFSFDQIEGVANWTEIRDLGKESGDKHKDALESIKKEITEDDVASLIYTSGTTGNSKGVMLSHKNLCSNFVSVSNVFQLTSDEIYLCIMPICHVGERMGNYQSQYSGCDIYYGQNLGTIADDLKEVGPHGFGTVPRVLEKVYDKVMQKANALTGMKKKMFFWALNLGLEYDNKGKGAWYKLQMKLANKLIFSKWREAMGGNIKAIGVGGAALQPRLEKVFWAANIKLLNMYGLTETSPTCTINRMDNIKFGTVGFALPGVEVKIAEDGEILAKGPNIMLGYYKDEKTTSEVLKDGWFATGDIGELDGDGFLRITDRKKSLFKLSNGKYVAPQAIENMFKESEFIDQLMVIGEGQKFTSALISPNWEMLRGWCRENNVNAATLEDAISNKEVVTHFNALVKQINPKLGKDEQLKRVRLVKDEWTPDSGELSPTLKLKRKVIREKYTTVIDEIFGLSSEN